MDSHLLLSDSATHDADAGRSYAVVITGVNGWDGELSLTLPLPSSPSLPVSLHLPLYVHMCACVCACDANFFFNGSCFWCYV